MGWQICPKGIYYALMFTKEEFGDIPVYIAENGMAAQDIQTEAGEIMDIDRVEYLRAHLDMAHRAVRDGCNLKGYFVWSLLDNFEWAWGYSKRFGIVRVDYETMKRTLKLSGEYYAKVITQNSVF